MTGVWHTGFVEDRWKGRVDLDAADAAAWKAINPFHDQDALRIWMKRHGPLTFAQYSDFD